jgi:hypothetical protein
MSALHVVWDLQNDPGGNLQHIAEHGVLPEEVEEVLHGWLSNTTASKSSIHRVTFGFTDAGRYLAVVWEHVSDDPLMIYPITAYDAPEPRKKRRK